MDYLYDIILSEFGRREIENTPIPNHISDNLKSGFGKRGYQSEAFRRFILCNGEIFQGKPQKPFHLLYNMATGSGKTLIMAGLMLHLYQMGYRNFLFFVHSTNIIQKTKANFLDRQSSKYLFNQKVVFDGKEVMIKEIESFEESDNNNINIKFTTVQQLHIDLNNTKENCVTYEDFNSIKVVMFGDEAHHLSSATRNNGELFGTWEGTALEILNQNIDNILLEFTATMDFDNQDVLNKYKGKVLFKYDLAQYRKDKYSKEINLIRSTYNEDERILQALILNLYRQEMANANGVNLKPIILFKAKRTIKESEANKTRFHKQIEDLNERKVEQIEKTSTVPIVQRAFSFFNSKGIAKAEIVKRIQANFKLENCLSANNDAEAEKNQILLNTLEDENNPIRAIFAVQKLNEGWDVLNLFDIVRLYEDRDGRDGVPGKTTVSEAQLIGRGARYYPFKLEEGQDKFRRKFDDDVDNDFRVLEELYYHTKEDSRYISELKKALIDTGIYEDENDLVEKRLTLKSSFKNTDFFKTGIVFFNKRLVRSFNDVRSFSDLGVLRKNYRYKLSSGAGIMTTILADDTESEKVNKNTKLKDVGISEIPRHIVRYALTQNPFFHFDRLIHYMPGVKSHSEFIDSEKFLSGLEITFEGTQERINSVSNFDYLQAVNGMLQSIEAEIKEGTTEYKGSDYIHLPISQVFRDKVIRVNKKSERANGQEELVLEFPWYAYNANFGTSEEKKFVELFARKFDSIEQKFENIFLIRNERELKIYDSFGRAFEPDFLLFCRQKQGEQLSYQVFIEPKGDFLMGKDKWKEDFLKEMRAEKKSFEIETDRYLITGIPFYNYENENQFAISLGEVLGLKE